MEGCSADWVAHYLSIALSSDSHKKMPEPAFFLYRISYMYYTPLGTIGAIAIGLVVSYLSGKTLEIWNAAFAVTITWSKVRYGILKLQSS